MSIENLSLSAPVVRNREIVLTARFIAVTFRQDDKGKAAPAPAPTKASDAGKPLPPAATPAGAKARVEDAIKNNDAKSTDAANKAAGEGSQKLKEGL